MDEFTKLHEQLFPYIRCDIAREVKCLQSGRTILLFKMYTRSGRRLLAYVCSLKCFRPETTPQSCICWQRFEGFASAADLLAASDRWSGLAPEVMLTKCGCCGGWRLVGCLAVGCRLASWRVGWPVGFICSASPDSVVCSLRSTKLG